MLSLEAMESLALTARRYQASVTRGVLSASEPPRGRMPDVRPLADAKTEDAALRVLFAEVLHTARTQRAATAFETAWSREPITLPHERDVALRALDEVLAAQAEPAHRAALMRAADARALEHAAVARDLVTALRSASDDDPSLAIGWGAQSDVLGAADTVLASTAEAFRELEGWARARVGLPRTGELRWEDRVRTAALVRTSEVMPLADRAGIASRWWARIGMSPALARVRDDTVAPDAHGTGPFALCDRADDRVSLVGAPALDARGVAQFTAALSEAVAWGAGAGSRGRFGVDRLHPAVAYVLGRRLTCDATFVMREAGVDRGTREPVMLERAHAELFVMRVTAALARYGVSAMSQHADLAARMREAMLTAVGSTPDPRWGVHLAARWHELQAGPRTIAAVIEPQLFEQLRDRHDQDWFRNPHAGETLSSALTAMRTEGTLAWSAPDDAARKALASGGAITRRVTEWIQDARR